MESYKTYLIVGPRPRRTNRFPVINIGRVLGQPKATKLANRQVHEDVSRRRISLVLRVRHPLFRRGVPVETTLAHGVSRGMDDFLNGKTEVLELVHTRDLLVLLGRGLVLGVLDQEEGGAIQIHAVDIVVVELHQLEGATARSHDAGRVDDVDLLLLPHLVDGDGVKGLHGFVLQLDVHVLVDHRGEGTAFQEGHDAGLVLLVLVLGDGRVGGDAVDVVLAKLHDGGAQTLDGLVHEVDHVGTLVHLILEPACLVSKENIHQSFGNTNTPTVSVTILERILVPMVAELPAREAILPATVKGAARLFTGRAARVKIADSTPVTPAVMVFSHVEA